VKLAGAASARRPCGRHRECCAVPDITNANLAIYLLHRAQEELEAAAADLALAGILVREGPLGGHARVLAEAVESEREAVEEVIERQRFER
jgi:hypothetical protein